MKDFLKRFGYVIIILFFTSCEKDTDQTIPPPHTPVKGVYVLTEGVYGANNSRIAYRDLQTGEVFTDFFQQQNPSVISGLGDTGNDMLLYGGKLYIVLNNSGNVTVLNATTGELLNRISFINGGVNRNPRFAASANGKVYVSSYDNSVSEIDTTTLSITRSVTVGANPEHLVAFNDHLFVANSGGLNFPNYDSTVSVINLNSFTEVDKITVGLNPQRLAVANNGNIYVTGYGDAFAPTPIPAFVSVINGNTLTFSERLPETIQFSHIRIHENRAYLFNNFGSQSVTVLNTDNNSVIRNNFITDGTTLQNIYAVDVNDENGDVYLCDSKDFISPGEVFCFDDAGRLKFSFTVAPGISPNRSVFLR